MTPKTLLDTDILSEILKQRDPVVLERALRYSEAHRQFSFTAITVHEIVFGLESRSAHRQLDEALTEFARNEVIIPTLADYRLAGELRGRARRSGQQLAIADCLIGSVAQRLGLPLATGNTNHFLAMRAVGLTIEIVNWRIP